MPRVVRLGRAANDNIRQPGLNGRLVAVILATTLTMFVLYFWRLV